MNPSDFFRSTDTYRAVGVRRQDRARRVRALTGSILAAGLIAAIPVGQAGPVGTAAAQGHELLGAPDGPMSQWRNPSVREDDAASGIEIRLDTPLENIDLGTKQLVNLTIENRSEQVVDNLSLRFQRADAVEDTAAARLSLTDHQSTYGYTGPFTDVAGPLRPGDSVTVALPLDTAPGSPDGLGIGAPGVYPVMINLNGRTGEGIIRYLTSERFLLAVTDRTTGSLHTRTSQENPAAEVPGITMLWPLTAPTGLVAGETGEAPMSAPLLLENDDLAAQLQEGGRLDRLLDIYLEATEGESGSALREATCLAVDPQLIEVVDRMRAGYTVATERLSPVSDTPRLRDSWRADSSAPRAEQPGGGAVAADAWLARLRTAAGQGCTVALPWAGTDINAVSRTGNQWLVREALSRGTSIIADVLDTEPERNLVIPLSGYVTESTAAWLPLADTTGPADTVNPESAWELLQQQGLPTVHHPADTAALEDPAMPEPYPRAAFPAPATGVRVLVTDNSVWGAPARGRFTGLGPGVTGVSYEGSLAATLAATGPEPLTVGYSNPETRHDPNLDSERARLTTGNSAVRLAVDAARQSVPVDDQGTAAPEPVIIVPPAAPAAPAASAELLGTVARLLETGQARPLTLHEATTPDAATETTLSRSAGPADPNRRMDRFGPPFPDPSAPSDDEVLAATQQSNYMNDLTQLMVNDPGIALTRYAFMRPLMLDLLRGLTVIGRRNAEEYAASTAHADHIFTLNREMLEKLQSSVALLPPGYVYTRVSQSSPLLIVARNGLPLPVDGRISYLGPPGSVVHVPDQLWIPAKGSIMTQMTADLPNEPDKVTLVLRLSGSQGSVVSDPVEITVQTQGPLIGLLGRLIVGLLVLALILRLIQTKIMRRIRGARNTETHSG
ncbi:hypothetical protein OS128_12250 [Corynebacterium sp. P5848]|uniref:hypothetical protein n=1 Tax=Corynebacterium marambiense TaxID=2765364 RepID=UPI0022608583|nr:hypothetical protein [Corynebacterium marambiense]MCX7543676.1 hypothetical protein [Corynebacterium marambiense]